MTDERFDLEKYLRLAGEAGEHDAALRRLADLAARAADAAEQNAYDAVGEGETPSPPAGTTDAAEQDAAPQPTLFGRLARWVRQRALARVSAPNTQDAPYGDGAKYGYASGDLGYGGERSDGAEAIQPRQRRARRRHRALPSADEASVPSWAAVKAADAALSTATGDGPGTSGASDEASYADETRVADAAPPPETLQDRGTAAPSVRARDALDGGSVSERFDTHDASSGTQPRTHAQPATSPPLPYAKTPAASPGYVAGRSAAAQRRPSGAAPTLAAITRALDRELRRYG